MADRVSQSVFEVLSNNANSNARISQNVFEVLTNNSDSHSRVSQMVIELLVSSADIAPPTPPITARRFGPAIGAM